MKKRNKKEHCDNCGANFVKDANFCQNCGQENHVPNQPIKHLVLEFFESLFHFDTKFFYSLKNLILFPGKMTKEFNENKRARFVPPIRQYIFVSAIFFIIVNYVTNKSFNSENVQYSSGPLDIEVNDFAIDSTDNIEDLQKMNNHQLDSVLKVKLEGKAPGTLTKIAFKQFVQLSKGQGTFLSKLMNLGIKYFSIMLFILMPFFAFLLWLIFHKRKKNYYEYLIFSIQYHTVSFVLLSCLLLIYTILDSDWIIAAGFVLLIIYLYKSMKLNYGLTRIKSALLSSSVFFVYCIFLSISVAIAMLGGFMFA
ncbi:MAG: DUF3667 domain-containing protein [Saprospiraceae bacterium]|nr:DUF3667 domain-containing protein [Saprospiraceae bacterium]